MKNSFDMPEETKPISRPALFSFQSGSVCVMSLGRLCCPISSLSIVMKHSRVPTRRWCHQHSIHGWWPRITQNMRERKTILAAQPSIPLCTLWRNHDHTKIRCFVHTRTATVMNERTSITSLRNIVQRENDLTPLHHCYCFAAGRPRRSRSSNCLNISALYLYTA